MKKSPIISVNIPVITDGDVSIVINSLKKVDYPKSKFEIIIVEGNQIAKQRNEAVKRSKGKIVYLLDDDSRVRKNSLKLIEKEFEKSKVAALGGPSVVYNKNYFNILLERVLETYFGAMRMKFRYSKQSSGLGSEYKLIGANLALRKSAVIKAGMFNEKIVPNEETELLRRLQRAGYLLKYNKELFVKRDHRRNIQGIAKQFFHYGNGRMKQILHSVNKKDFIFILPMVFLLYLITIPFTKTALHLLPLLIYLTLGTLTSTKAALKYRDVSLIPTMMSIFPVIHLSYSLGMVWELVTQLTTQTDHKVYISKPRVVELE